MTKQEADFIGSMNMCDEISNEAYKKIICHCDVEESQPCEDAISRAEIIHTLNTMDRYVADELTLCDTNKKYPKNEVFIVDDVYELVAENLSSVTPKFTDEEIQKMQDLEQAQLEKAYELGKAKSFEEWLSSFNTESAPQCFNAVQELKKQIEKKQNT